MRICISTFFEGVNYGSRLQATALAAWLRQKGYDVVFIDGFSPKRYLLRHPSLLFWRLFNKVHRKEREAFFRPVEYEVSQNRQRRLEAFTEDNCPRVNFDSDSKWQAAVANGDIFVAGGDIIWQPALGYPTRFMLDFAHFTHLTRFSFGSSVGNPDIPPSLRPAYRKYLRGFKAIGVREAGTARLLQDITGRTVEKVIDPTLLLSAEEWDAFAEKAALSVNVDPGRYILCYFVMEDPDYWEYAWRLQKARGLEVVALPMHTGDERQPCKVVLDGTPCEFLWLVKNAAVICTDSLHACIFSLIYKKPFQLLRRKRKAEDEKYEDFLERYHLGDCEVKDRQSPMAGPSVDYDAAHRQLELDRQNAFDFLDRALS